MIFSTDATQILKNGHVASGFAKLVLPIPVRALAQNSGYTIVVPLESIRTIQMIAI